MHGSLHELVEKSDEEKAKKLNRRAEENPEKARSDINEMVELLNSDGGGLVEKLLMLLEKSVGDILKN